MGHKRQRLFPAGRDLVNLVAAAGRDVDVDLLTAALGSTRKGWPTRSTTHWPPARFNAANRDGERLVFGHALLRQAALGGCLHFAGVASITAYPSPFATATARARARG